MGHLSRRGVGSVHLKTSVCCALLLGLAGCKGTASARAEQRSGDSVAVRGGPDAVPIPVVGSLARVGDLVLTVATTGQVRSAAVARLRAETGGAVAKILVVPGQQVRKGEPLVEFDPRPLDLAVREAEAALAQAEVQYADMVVPESISTGRPASAERKKTASVRAGLEGATARLERARFEREKGVVLAPFDAVVDRVEVAEGERVAAGTEVATVVDMAHLRVEATVLEHDLPNIRAGGEATVRPAGLDRPVHGSIVTVLPLVDSASRAGRVVVSLDAPSGLRPGTFADVRLEAGRLPGRLLVPASAVIEREGRPLVFVVRDGRAQWVYVRPGRSNGAWTEILPDTVAQIAPVHRGDTVLVEGHLTLTHDAPVRVLAGAR